MPTPITINEMAAAVTSCNGHGFVFTTLSPTPGKDEDHVFVHVHDARVHL